MSPAPKSRQALWQAARRKRKLCAQCGTGKLATAWHCRPCADANSARNLARYHARRGALTPTGGESVGGDATCSKCGQVLLGSEPVLCIHCDAGGEGAKP